MQESFTDAVIITIPTVALIVFVEKYAPPRSLVFWFGFFNKNIQMF